VVSIRGQALYQHLPLERKGNVASLRRGKKAVIEKDNTRLKLLINEWILGDPKVIELIVKYFKENVTLIKDLLPNASSPNGQVCLMDKFV